MGWAADAACLLLLFGGRTTNQVVARFVNRCSLMVAAPLQALRPAGWLYMVRLTRIGFVAESTSRSTTSSTSIHRATPLASIHLAFTHLGPACSLSRA